MANWIKFNIKYLIKAAMTIVCFAFVMFAFILLYFELIKTDQGFANLLVGAFIGATITLITTIILSLKQNRDSELTNLKNKIVHGSHQALRNLLIIDNIFKELELSECDISDMIVEPQGKCSMFELSDIEFDKLSELSRAIEIFNNHELKKIYSQSDPYIVSCELALKNLSYFTLDAFKEIYYQINTISRETKELEFYLSMTKEKKRHFNSSFDCEAWEKDRGKKKRVKKR